MTTGQKCYFFVLLFCSFGWGLQEDIYRYNLSIDDSSYSEICKNPYITTIRDYFNIYINEKAFRDSLRATGEPVARVFQNDSLYEQYYRNQFVVLRTLLNPFGGIQAVIVFVGHPGIAFSAWIYRIDEDEYQLRSVERMNISRREIKNLSKQYHKAKGTCTF